MAFVVGLRFAFVGTADGDTRHEAEAIAPACVGLGIGELRAREGQMQNA